MHVNHSARLFSLMLDSGNAGGGGGSAAGGSAGGAGGGSTTGAATRSTNTAGQLQINRTTGAGGGGGGGGGGAAPDFTIDSCFENGQFLGGRFDAEGHQITRELFDQNPGLVNVAKTLQESRRKITELTQGKVQLAEPLSNDLVGQLDFTITEGKLPKDTVKALVGRPMDEAFIGDVLVPLLDRATATDRAANEAWLETWNTSERFNGQLDDAISWAGANLSNTDLEDMNAALRSPKMRDAAMEQLLRDFRAANGGGGGNAGSNGAASQQARRPIIQDNTTGFNSGAGGGGGFPGQYAGDKSAVDSAYQADLVKAKTNEEKRAIDAKLDRTYKSRGW